MKLGKERTAKNLTRSSATVGTMVKNLNINGFLVIPS